MEAGPEEEGKRILESGPPHPAGPVCYGHLDGMDRPLTPHLRAKVGTGHNPLGKNATRAAVERNRQEKSGVAPGMAVARTKNLDRHENTTERTRGPSRGRSEAGDCASGWPPTLPGVDEGNGGMGRPLRLTEPSAYEKRQQETGPLGASASPGKRTEAYTWRGRSRRKN